MFNVNDAALKLFNKQMGKLNKYIKLLNTKKMIFRLNTILAIYFLVIMFIIGLCHHEKKMKKYYSCHH